MNPTLDYETPDPTRRRRKWLIVAIVFAAGCAFGALAIIGMVTVTVPSATPATPVYSPPSPPPPVPVPATAPSNE
jgi:hypothetical protein